MRPYETMIIFDVDAEDTAINAVIDRTLELVKANGGTPGAVDRWGRRTFAYELKKKREGYYVVAEFTAEASVSTELDRFLTLADEVLRHKIMRLPDQVAGRGRPGAKTGRTPAATAASDAG